MKNNSIRPAGFVCDEMGNMNDRQNFDAMASGQRSVLNPLKFRTTTAYAIDNSIMTAELDYCDKVLNEIVDDENMFALIYRADFEELWTERGIYQANPLVIEENFDMIRKDREKALLVPEVREEYLTKSMNYFVPANAGDTYVEAEDVQQCEIVEDDFDWEGKTVKIGLDLAMSGDNVGVAMTHYDVENEIFTSMAVGFIPVLKLDEKIKKERCDYRRYIEEGHCIACGDKKISYMVIENFIMDIQEKYGVYVSEVGYDSWNAISTKNRLEDNGYMCTEIQQHARVTYPGAKRLREEIQSHTYQFIANGLLKENFANAKIFPDNNMGYYVNKKKSEGKVDLVVAIINSMVLWLLEINDGTSTLYENKEIILL